jgi:hypothetical protein
MCIMSATDGVAVNGAKEADPWDEPDSEDGRANGDSE